VSGALRFGVAVVAADPPEEFVRTVQLAEALGFDSVWLADYRLYRDVYAGLALAALNSTRIRLGCAVTNPYTRHPALTAVGIASVDELSGGRAVLGLGAGGLVLTLLQLEQRQPVQACRSAVASIRRYLGGDAARGGGRRAPTDEDVRLDFPARGDLPIFIAATGRKMLALAGEIADGVIVNVGAHAGCVDMALSAVEAGMAAGGRPPEALERLCWLQGCALSADGQAALNAVKATAALVLGNSPTWMLEAMGIEEHAAQEIHRVYYAQGAQAAAERVSDEMADKFTIAGTPPQTVAKLRRLAAQGFDEIIFLIEESGEGVREAMQMLAEMVVAELRASAGEPNV
jgi:5,10-methylenetetrahydromethanopterin reductase